MSDIVIKVENLSKQYRLGLVGTGTLAHDLNRWWCRMRGKEDPYLKVGQANDRTTKGTSEYVWALQDVNFEVKRGEVLGIIGRNGAGKSTLLKILSRVTAPTTGSVKAKGRIASLLEVGTGFHQELTGRENVYLNGAINGMSRAEVDRKLDEIVDFSGCERYIDTPVKRYSSGMTVRLGFAVAAYLEPEILIVDEVLAVGDAEFQKKCIGKMQDVAGQGRTVLFVSHNMAAIKRLCHRGILLTNGTKEFEGDIKDCIIYYLAKEKTAADNLPYIDLTNHPDKKSKSGIQNVLLKRDNVPSYEFFSGDSVEVVIKIEKGKPFINPEFGLGIRDSSQQYIVCVNNNHLGVEFSSIEGNACTVTFMVPKLYLYGKIYYHLDLFFGDIDIPYEIIKNAANIVVHPNDVYSSGKLLNSSENLLWFDGLEISASS